MEKLTIYLDESGNFDFSPSGTKYYIIGALSGFDFLRLYDELRILKDTCIDEGLHDLRKFRASTDKQAIRDKVFEVIKENCTNLRIDSVIVEKCKTFPPLYNPQRFYPKMIGYLVRHVVSCYPKDKVSEIEIITDTIPVANKKKVIERTIKNILNSMVRTGHKLEISHLPSSESYGLQVADYINWAKQRKWERGDLRSYVHIEKFVKSEFDIFRTGSKKFY